MSCISVIHLQGDSWDGLFFLKHKVGKSKAVPRKIDAI